MRAQSILNIYLQKVTGSWKQKEIQASEPVAFCSFILSAKFPWENMGLALF